MSVFDIDRSLDRARQRLEKRAAGRKKRSDVGKFRLAPEVQATLRESLNTDSYPGLPQIRRTLAEACQRHGVRCPSRSTVWKFIRQDPVPNVPVEPLPDAVRSALYNLQSVNRVPAAQLVFYCFNYGELPAVQFASSLPWRALFQAYRMRGWRPMSRGLLRAVMVVRRIPRV